MELEHVALPTTICPCLNSYLEGIPLERRAQSPRNCILASVPRQKYTNTDSGYRADAGQTQWELNTGSCLDNNILGSALSKEHVGEELSKLD